MKQKLRLAKRRRIATTDEHGNKVILDKGRKLPGSMNRNKSCSIKVERKKR